LGNVWWLSWISFGESWHNNHQAFPTSAFHGLRRFEIDPGGWLIWTLENAASPGESSGSHHNDKRPS
jgi:fatty-acid desaturase